MSKNYKQYIKKRKHAYQLDPGLKGFLCTCSSKLREKDCVRESYNLLNEFADDGNSISEPQVKTEEKEDAVEEDIDTALEKEIESIKTKNLNKTEQRRFQVLDTGANGVVFIKTTIDRPVDLAHKILLNIAETKQQKSKFLVRLLPVEVTCKAYIKDIAKACEKLFDHYFVDKGVSFAVVYNHRLSGSLDREELIKTIADIVSSKNSENKANLKTPDLVVLVEVIKNICCLAVIPDYFTLRKYNLLEVANPTPKLETADNIAGDQSVDKHDESLDKQDKSLDKHDESLDKHDKSLDKHDKSLSKSDEEVLSEVNPV